ncbi:DUF86 domain-containing protein [Candidatus Gottesmanbacteria bacterium]|nr:DUF86 domain-containing protein [Candidatus Gottesmanbacteria bacterium]
MLESIEHISTFLQDIDEEQFSRDIQLQDAVIRRLGIIGEAAARLTNEIREKAPKIPWKSIIGLRNIVMHEYSNIKLGEVWDVIQNDLPPLKDELKKLLLVL